MENTNLIDVNQYFIESEKVIQIVKDREEELRRTLPAKYKLEIAKESLEKAATRESYEKLQNTIKDLEYEIKFGNNSIPAIPEEHQNRIAFNRVHEEEQIDIEIAKQKELLLQILDGLENPLMNVLTNIENLEVRKLIGTKVDILLDEKITKDPRIHSPFRSVSYLSFSAGERNSKSAREKGEELFKALKKIATEPTISSGLPKPSLFKRILGGNK
ncbi:hypothetical protein [Peribacillus phoenicis]|uniref:hypothetical protein n=1 Tax=Peribacillus sp. 1P06PA-2 TaxID=3132295 RepID=UPI0039A642BA